MSAVAMIFAAGAVSAQGPLFLGGSVGADFGKASDKTKATEFSIIPEVGYMLNDNWGLTLGLGYGTASLKPDGADSQTQYSLFGVALGAIYKYEIVDKFFFAPTFQVGYANESEAKTSFIGANLSVLRFEFRPSDKWGFNVNFGGIGFTSTKPDEGDSATNFGLNVGSNGGVINDLLGVDGPTIGFNYYF